MTSTLPAPPVGPPGVPRANRWLRGRADDAAWVRPALLALLSATAMLYLWGLGASGWANSFYAAAAQAGSQSWTAFFFGSSDAANSITVDKTPASLWVDGVVGAAVRGQRLEPAGAPGADGRGHGRAAVRDRAPLVRPGGRA